MNVTLLEDEFTLTATIHPEGISERVWPFPHLLQPAKRFPSHLTCWQRILTQSSVKDRTYCYRLINELRQSVRSMEAYMEAREDEEKRREEERRREQVRQHRAAMRQRRERQGPYIKPPPPPPPPNSVKSTIVKSPVNYDSSDDDFTTPAPFKARLNSPLFKPCLNSPPCEASLLSSRCNCE